MTMGLWVDLSMYWQRAQEVQSSAGGRSSTTQGSLVTGDRSQGHMGVRSGPGKKQGPGTVAP